MAQFDVHVNPGRQRSAIPFVVSVQSRRLDGAHSRLVIPLVRMADQRALDPRINLKFVVGMETLVLDPLALFAAPASVLGPVVALLADDADAGPIIGAIDAVITTAFG